MCNECCKQCGGWCRSFTTTELLLSILEAVLLAVLIAFITFLILHLKVCLEIKYIENPLGDAGFTKPDDTETSNEAVQTRTTLSPEIECTWTPSQKTTALTQYFEQGKQEKSTKQPTSYPKENEATFPEKNNHTMDIELETLSPDLLDGEIADNEKFFVMALVKVSFLNVPYTMGCTLTVISEFWTLTAASCIEFIEETDSLDTYVIMSNIGEPAQSRTYALSEVVMHPKYRRFNKTYDIIAVKSAKSLSTSGEYLKLPTMVDYFLVTIGERLLVLGFGKFRSKEKKDKWSRRVHAAAVHVLPRGQCGAGGGGGAGGGAVCAGVVRARAAPCRYCAGAPLLRGRALLGLMSRNERCAAACGPALYVNVAALTDWLDVVLNRDSN